jgi:predicted PurR-regulated permease PerM
VPNETTPEPPTAEPSVLVSRPVTEEPLPPTPVPPAAISAARGRGRRLVTIAAAVVIVFGLHFAQDFLVPLVIAIMVAAISSPLVTYLVRRGAPTVLGAALVMGLDIAVLGGVGRLLLLAASDLQDNLPNYIAKFSALNQALAHYLQSKGLHQMAQTSWLPSEQVSALIKGFIGDFASLASHGALVMFVVFFALCEIPQLGEKLRNISDDADLQFERIDRIVRQVQLYLVVKLWTSLLAGLGAFIVLKLAGVELALLLAMSLFLLHFIPNIGPAIATVPAVVFALIDRGPGTAATVGVAYLTVNTLVGNLIEPRMLGTRLGMSPFVVLVGMLFWGWVWGPAGALISVPILAATKIVLENIPDLAWVGELADHTVRHGSEPLPRASRVGVGLGAHDRVARPASRSARETINGFASRRRSERHDVAPRGGRP